MRFRAAWPLLVVVAVVVANLPALIGLVDVSPLGPVGGTTLASHASFLAGSPWTDPNTGFTSQALGHLAAEDWLHGVVPWWNPFAGLGTPLAADMQSAAFFPPTLLLVFAQGQLLFHITLELIAGLATYFLVRELGLSAPIAAVGGILYGLDGSLAWFGNAPANPVAFLPLMLLGVERIAKRVEFDLPGWAILVLGVALCIYSGFPEVAYLEGLAVLAWFVYRVATGPAAGRLRAALRIAAAVCSGLLVAAPIAIAFAEYVRIGDLGGHTGGFARSHLSTPSLIQLGLPYLYGPIDAFNKTDPTSLTSMWGHAGGYVTLPVLALALVGLVFSQRALGLRILLVGLAGVLLLWTFGVPPVQTILDHLVPAAGRVAVERYSMPAPELAVGLLACFGVEALVERRGRALALALAVAVGSAAAVALADVGFNWSTLHQLDQDPSYHIYPLLMLIWAGGLVLLIAVGCVIGELLARRDGPATSAERSPRLRIGGAIAGALLALDAVVMFGLPQLSASRSQTIDYQVVPFLTSHLGEQRFFSLSLYRPNYGSYYGISSLAEADLPIPTAWEHYVEDQLLPDSIAFQFGQRTDRSLTELLDRLPAYEASGVEYVMLPSSEPSPSKSFVKVFEDPLATIYRLPHTTPFFSTPGSPCKLSSSNVDSVVASCPGPATLRREELEMPGWSATINGRSAPISTIDDGLESVQLPLGTSTVVFSYSSPHSTASLFLFLIGFLALVGVPPWELWRRRRRSGAEGTNTDSWWRRLDRRRRSGGSRPRGGGPRGRAPASRLHRARRPRQPEGSR